MINDNSHQIASVIEESCPKDLQGNLYIKSARQTLKLMVSAPFIYTYIFFVCFFFFILLLL